MRDAVIVDAVRTPIGKRNGSLADVHPVDLSATVLSALAQRTGFDPATIDDVVWGCVSQVGDQSGSVGRLAVLAADWPQTVPATVVDRRCGSAQQAVHFAAAGVISGQYEVAIAGGVESMSRVPMGSARAAGVPYPPSVLDRFGVDTFNQGVGAEMIASRWGMSRTQVDEYSARSHERTAAAADAGAFDSQLVKLNELAFDEGLRRTTTVETLAGLKTAFDENGVITAGNSSQISDGAAGLLITSSEYAKQQGWTPIARVHTAVLAADDPVIMLTGPIPATQKALQRSGLSIADIGAFEVNEAFAPVPMAWQAETGASDDVLNPLGGAIAVGHPLGGSGAILMTRLVHHMRDNGIRYGLQTMCEAGGMANATILELVD
ncbi:MAG TPA: acetyl-CoA C-acyltransferase [Gordonia sp. (in: high G+C Gram-positive bacteria)]|uniref:thiolase family protein n=1 Tax=unclassified Gordonia (in: high G+C Gram-positive bacteria) TaxID=2657482 RepID=UPI000F98B795|nr:MULTISPECIES: acetyl-CoA C-acyltransferase [unclassified Gordonia (in: high G+C Gram-positive bacteria)]RUP37235.1 MAG: acetyl-CoA C-acyltransferase [Gordonia sp. (in: high G+C Gram-positive bacteria)]HNP56273.1 acetyl-CoA C-acyltransferase [Gordonia sp. (in: high G+C Gram-positive bacteria)]HRC52093.1 acetyl-CoA C-acyltransferase [Gordonia sp. (in: high G+C Gram-positive bacteria)]